VMSSDWTRRTVLQLGIVSVPGVARLGLLTEPVIGSNSVSSETARSAKTEDVKIWHMGVVDLARAIRHREVSCQEVIEAHLDRIRAVNGSVNAVTIVLGEQAHRAAEKADRDLARRRPIGPLHGVPMTVKENIDLAGSSTTEGIEILRDNVVGDDSPHIAQLRRAGAIPIGRTNMPDLGLRWHTDSGLRGRTRNN